MVRCLVLAVALASLSASASAFTWYVFPQASTNKDVFFFDRDTALRKGDTQRVWIKSVREERVAKAEGVSGVTSMVEFACGKRTVRYLTVVTYGTDGTPRESSHVSADETEVPPSSAYGKMLQAACSPEFPRSDAPSDAYRPVPGNDLEAYALRYFDSVRTKRGAKK